MDENMIFDRDKFVRPKMALKVLSAFASSAAESGWGRLGSLQARNARWDIA